MLAHIPITLGDISRIDFRYDAKDTSDNTLTIQTINLVSGQQLYCTHAGYNPDRVNSLWISDLDNKEPGTISGGLSQPAGKSACVGAFGWTGEKCCGDDSRESYADTQAGCWNGEFISNGNTVMDVKITQYPFACTSDTCKFPLAAPADHPPAYTITQNDQFSIASNVPQQVLFDTNSFFGCMHANFVGTGIDFTDKQALLCSSKGRAICSPLMRGWEILPTAPSASDPISIKSIPVKINLLKNPRFDE